MVINNMEDELNKLKRMCGEMRELLSMQYDHQSDEPDVTNEYDEYALGINTPDGMQYVRTDVIDGQPIHCFIENK
jgi:hypothetical protein